LDDGLRDGEDVRLGERTLRRGAAMAAGAEADQLLGVVDVGPALVVVALQFRDVDQQLGGRGLSGKRMDCHDDLLHALAGSLWRARPRGDALARGSRLNSVTPTQSTGHGSTFQMSAAYSWMVRSLENLPEQATLMIALRAHASRSAYSRPTCCCVCAYEVRS